ncbi:hypothetical protein [Saccharibacillus sp. O23]|uniref:hypothetical protein n=1 Tax=Saccharibacillus sp. O23 TaxID=2009338 RepID=UPI00117A9923|nr:hypothetical protein [Saccharibacillus sp. O23]
MKFNKTAIGLTAGLLLFGGTAAAASSSLVGHKVSAVIGVERHGKPVAEAIVVQGRSYVPVRSLEEAAGVTYAMQDNGKIGLSDSSSSIEGQLTKQKSELVRLKSEIEQGEQTVHKLQALMPELSTDAGDPTTQSSLAAIQKKLEENRAAYAHTQTIVSVLEELSSSKAKP